MLFFTKKIVVLKHAKDRMRERVLGEKASDKAIRDKVLSDFQVKNIRKKTPKGENGDFKVWVHGSRLYVCQEKENTIFVITVIQMLPQDEERIIREINSINLD